MKKVGSFIILVAITTLAIVTFSGAIVGCGSTPASKAVQIERVVILGVNDAMTEWASYVNAGKATKDQVAKVKLGYDSYVVAQATAKAVIEKAITSGSSDPNETALATQAVKDAEAQLIDLVNSFIK
jgi:uncharacterized lipoprotein NlpE involved in copper resistance